MTAWRTAQVQELSERVTVGFVGSQADLFVEVGVPLLRGQNIKPFRLDLGNLKYISLETHERWRKSSLEEGDVAIVRVGYPGTACVIPAGIGPLNAASLVLVRPDRTKLNPHFLANVLNSSWGKAQIGGRIVGSAQQVLNTGLVANLAIPCPPIETQNRIAGVLCAYDDLIENNTRRIEILEEMAQAIYREWFVNFRYPGHEAVPLVDSELGPIPESWSVSTVGDIAELVRGRSYRSNELAEEGGLPFFNLKCIERDGGFRKSGIKRYTGKYNENQKTSAGDIVVAVTDMTQERRLVARAARIPTVGEPFGIISLDLAKLIPFEGLGSDYLLGMLRFSGFADEVKNHANGVNVLHLHPQRIVEFRFALAPSPLRHRYCEVVAPMFALADVLRMSGEQLRLTRDLLLPRLISGEVDVSELDIDVGEFVT